MDDVPAEEGVQHRHSWEPVAAMSVTVQTGHKALLCLTDDVIRFLTALGHRKDKVGSPRLVQVSLNGVRWPNHKVRVSRAGGASRVTGGALARVGAVRFPRPQKATVGSSKCDRCSLPRCRLRPQIAEGRRGMHVMVRQLLGVSPGVAQRSQDRQDPVLSVGGVHRIHTAAPASGQETNNSHEKAAGNKWSRSR